MNDGSLAPAEPYTLAFETTVERAVGDEVVLEETYFYPEGGGQPADRGVLAGVPVTDVQDRDGDVVHALADGRTPAAGEVVEGAVDPGFRTYCMRAHTASHALYGAGRRLLDELGYGGFDITDRKVRVDLSTPTDVTDGTIVELERLVNRAVWNSLAVSWETYPKEEALALDGIAFNTKTAEGIEGDTVRVVTIEGAEGTGAEGTGAEGTGAEGTGAGTGSVPGPVAGTGTDGSGAGKSTAEAWDVAACGGTHVRNTREIGTVTVLDRSNPGEGLTRVEFAVGSAAIERRVTEKDAALSAARRLDTNVDGLVDAVERLQEERDGLETELDDLGSRLVDARIEELREEVIERDGRTWLVGTVERVDANGLAERVRDLAGESADVVALVAPDGTLAVGTSGDVNANDVIAAVTDAFGGGGGGSPTVAQGGGFAAEANEIVAFLRDR